MHILDTIVAHKKKEVVIAGERTSVKDLEQSEYFSRQGLSYVDLLSDASNSGVIAEFKRKSWIL